MSGVTVSHVDGRVVAVKQAADHPDAVARLQAEADVLVRLDHPGIVQFVELDTGPPVRLVTSFVGPDSWARRPPTDPQLVVDGLAMLASIVADLHDSNIAHGALRPDHVLIGPGGRPVLCGLAEAGPTDDDSIAADCQAFASLIRGLTIDLPVAVGEQLNEVAGHLEQGSTIRSATRQLDQIGRPDASGLVGSSTRRPLAVAAGVVALIAVVCFAIIGLDGSDRQTATAAPVHDTNAQQLSASAGSSPSPPVTAPTVDATISTATVAPTTISPDSPTLVHDGRRFGIGSPGDLAISGDWDCNGTPTPAALRPSTGEIAVFADWPSPHHAIEPVFVTTVEGAVGIDVDTEEGCEQLRVRTATGSRILNPEFP